MSEIFFIAEIGLNHNGDLDLARRMIDAAQAAGASAAKFQSLRAEHLLAREAIATPIDGFGLKDVHTLGDFFRRVSLDEEFHYKIKTHCDAVDIEFMSTPFDFAAVSLLHTMGVKRIKIASGDLTHYPLLEKAAQTGVPIILSTGGSTLEEIRDAVTFLRSAGCTALTLLHCVSLYPTPPHLANLGAITQLQQEFDLPIGFSDHTAGIHMSLAAMALGACVIERHFTIDRGLPGPDQKLSLEPDAFEQMVVEGKQIAQALRDNGKTVSEAEQAVIPHMRRSIVAAHDLSEGHNIEEIDLEYKRPGTGLSPREWRGVIGSKLSVATPADGQIRKLRR
ncbi:MAG: N-acetylneuraminate synthase family protein [Leptospiraceae bacterium]|nr:N-acetylneuraminate synthase family protein [Leptospiraceae bacterium]MCB1319560.1 N-acetylneuraminate synthase family protein [Leptospiraceae bacterium]